jgi:signal peptidase I
LAIDIHPPRASSLTKLLRRWIPGETWYHTRDLTRQLHADLRASARRRGFELPPARSMPFMIAPGLALLHAGERVRGWLYLGSAALCLFLALPLIGSVVGSLLLGLAFGIHVGSNVSFLRQAGCARHTMARWGLLVAAGLLLGLYVPVGWLVSHYVSPITINLAAAPFQSGDVLLLNSRAFVGRLPQPGDVVLHRLAQIQYQIQNAGLYVIHEGEIIDRVLAGPGDRVEWNVDRLIVNGQPSDWLPLNPQSLPRKFTWQVPLDSVFILPSTSAAININTPEEILRRIGIVPASSIVGRVYFQTYPLSRWGRIR